MNSNTLFSLIETLSQLTNSIPHHYPLLPVANTGNLFSNAPVEAETIQHEEKEDGGVLNHLFTFEDHSTGEAHPISPWMVMGVVAVACFFIFTLGCLGFCWCQGCFKGGLCKKGSKSRKQYAEQPDSTTQTINNQTSETIFTTMS